MLQRAGEIEFAKTPAAHLAAVPCIAQFLLFLASLDRIRTASLEPAAIGHVHDGRHPAGIDGSLP